MYIYINNVYIYTVYIFDLIELDKQVNKCIHFGFIGNRWNPNMTSRKNLHQKLGILGLNLTLAIPLINHSDGAVTATFISVGWMPTCVQPASVDGWYTFFFHVFQTGSWIHLKQDPGWWNISTIFSHITKIFG